MTKFSISKVKALVQRRAGREPRKALFMHIQKTAGTSIIEIAKLHYGNNLISHGDHVGKSPESFNNIGFVSGHFGYEFASHFMPDRYSFTFLRDPKERIISMYRFLRQQKVNLFPMYKLAKELCLTDFLRAGLENSMVKQRLWNNQTWQLALGWANENKMKVEEFPKHNLLDLAITHLDSFDHIGFTNTFKYDIEKILNDLDLPTSGDSFIANASKQTELKLSIEDNLLLDELTKFDRQLYNIAKDIYAS